MVLGSHKGGLGFSLANGTVALGVAAESVDDATGDPETTGTTELTAGADVTRFASSSDEIQETIRPGIFIPWRRGPKGKKRRIPAALK